MRDKNELRKIAIGFENKEITTAEELNIDDLEKVFPTLMEMTLKEAVVLVKKDVKVVYEWNCKKINGTHFESWDYLTEDEWAYIGEVRSSLPPKNSHRPRRKRRVKRNVKG
jgi:hypothetical protein